MPLPLQRRLGFRARGAMRREPDLPDWKDGHAYDHLLQAERPVFAWEWLRRQPDYRAAALRCGTIAARSCLRSLPGRPEALRWGLHRFEDPGLPAPLARPMWSAERHRLVLNASARRCAPDQDSFELHQANGAATLVLTRGVARLLLSDGYRGIRIDVRGCGIEHGPVQLAYDLSGIAKARIALLVLQRFLAFAPSGHFSASLHPPDRRAIRQVRLLRAHDGLAAGACQRAIAAELLDQLAAEARWRFEAPSLRSRAQRLAKTARLMAAGGFWALLE